MERKKDKGGNKQAEEVLRDQNEELEATVEELRISEEELASQLEELQQSRDALRLKNFVFDASIAANSIADMNGVITEANAAFLKAWGYPSKAEVLGRPIPDFLQNQDEVAAILAALSTTGEWEGDYTAKRKDGTTFTAHGLASAVRDEGGKIIGYQSAVLDITESKRAEEALKESERKFRDTVTHLDEGYYSVTTDGRLLDHNLAFNQILGFDPARDLKGVQLPDFWQNPDDRKEYLNELMARGFIRNYLINAKKGNGEKIVVMAGAHLVKDEKGRVARIDGTFTDFTERKRAEEALKESEAKFKRLYDSNVIGVIFWDTAGNIIQANGEFLRIVGYTEEDVLSGKARWKDMTPPEYAYLDEKAIKEMTETGISAPFEKEYIRKDGSRVAIRLNAAFLKEEKEIGVCFIQDITERKQSEESLRRAMADLKRSNEELQQFAFVASHDLQEPLRAVASFTQLLSERYKGRLDTKADEFIAFAVEGANRMQTLINDLLTYSRLETRGKPPEPVDSHEALGRALANLGTAIQESGALVTNDDLPTLKADEGQLVQLFQNLIGNAIKFHGPEPPRVHVSAVPEGKEWLFSVRDNGIGIAQEYQERIFSIFQRLHSREEYPGTGIGLALCRRIVERHGGTIRVESGPEGGSTFFFTLPKA